MGYNPLGLALSWEESMTNTARKMRYIPGLDGVRAIAVAAVVLYHIHVPFMQGGLLGVTMFFVISGYIITRSLIHEVGTTKTIDFKGFYLRRVRRLLPAICLLIPVTVVLCALLNRVMLTKMRPDILPSLLFVNNWWQIFNQVSYFNALGDPSPLTHFWSLAIEEQFYLIWPFALFLMYRAGVKRTMVRRIVAALAVVSVLAMTVLYNPGGDPSRIYYGTDTRAFSLLAGVWLALLPMRRFELARGRDGMVVEALGVVGLVGLLLMFALSNGYTAFQYRGGMVLCTVFTMMLVAASAHRGGAVARLLALPPFVWLGKRSYGVYLWHYPLLLLMNPMSVIGPRPWWLTVLQLALVLLVAEVSYRYLEEPCRHGALGRLARQLAVLVRGGASEDEASDGDEVASKPAPVRRVRTLAPVAAYAAVVLAAVICVVAVPPASALSEAGARLLEGEQPNGEGSSATTAGYAEGAYDVLMIGDSVSVRTISSFQQSFPHGHIDAAVNRQFSDGISLLQQYLDQGNVGGIVVFALGTNGPVSNEQIDQVVRMVGEGRRLVFVTTRSPRDWVSSTNEVLQSAAQRYKNVRVVDWYGYSGEHPDVFDGDGTHVTEAGAKQYIDLVHQAISDVLPVHIGDGGNDPVPGLMQDFAQKMSQGVADRLAKGVNTAAAK